MSSRTEVPDVDTGLVAESLSHLAAVRLPPPRTDAAALLRRWRFLERARVRSRADERAVRPLAAGYALAAALLIAVTALPQVATLGAPPDPAAAAVVASLLRLLAWPSALVAGALVVAAGLLWADA
jgi:hypothetical protein